MSQRDRRQESPRDNFGGGFLLGAVLGGLLGGLIGANLAARYGEASGERSLEGEGEGDADRPGQDLPVSRRRRFRDRGLGDRLNGSSPEGIDVARRNLEAKIAQLNEVIDEVRQQLEETHSTPNPKPPQE